MTKKKKAPSSGVRNHRTADQYWILHHFIQGYKDIIYLDFSFIY